MLNAGPREPNICEVMGSELPLPKARFSLLTVHCTESQMSPRLYHEAVPQNLNETVKVYSEHLKDVFARRNYA
jgi:hypothetical protein